MFYGECPLTLELFSHEIKTTPINVSLFPDKSNVLGASIETSLRPISTETTSTSSDNAYLNLAKMSVFQLLWNHAYSLYVFFIAPVNSLMFGCISVSSSRVYCHLHYDATRG